MADEPFANEFKDIQAVGLTLKAEASKRVCNLVTTIFVYIHINIFLKTPKLQCNLTVSFFLSFFLAQLKNRYPDVYGGWGKEKDFLFAKQKQ